MQYALLIYETSADFARREQAGDDATYFGAWRAYYKAVVEAGIYAGVKPLDAPETGTTVRRRDGKPSCRTARMPARRSSWAASCCSSCRRSMRPWNGRRAARPPHMALWKSDRSLPNSSDASKVKTSADELAHRAVEAAARQSYGRLVALLAARTRDPAGAEDALADALLAALNTWARDGIPESAGMAPDRRTQSSPGSRTASRGTGAQRVHLGNPGERAL